MKLDRGNAGVLRSSPFLATATNGEVDRPQDETEGYRRPPRNPSVSRFAPATSPFVPQKKGENGKDLPGELVDETHAQKTMPQPTREAQMQQSRAGGAAWGSGWTVRARASLAGGVVRHGRELGRLGACRKIVWVFHLFWQYGVIQMPTKVYYLASERDSASPSAASKCA